MSAPAFTQVAARQTLHTQPAAMPHAEAPSQQPPARRIEWSPAVRDYVQRSFDPNLSYEVNRDEIQEMLKKVLTDAAENNRLETIDWAHFPLPHELVLNERKKRAQPAPQAPAAPWLANTMPLHVSGTNHFTAAVPSEVHSSQKKATQSKKRKSLEASDPDTTSIPPWRKANGHATDSGPAAATMTDRFEDRITYANKGRGDKKRAKMDQPWKNTSKYQADLEKRRQRFGNQLRSPPRDETPVPDVNDGPIVGTCEVITKHYFRLTAPPKPENVRPQRILEQTLDFLKKEWRKNGDYGFICDQFKSLRQDLTVQHIKNEFTVKAYEIHARIALEKGDLGEYNQCQTQLRALYSQNLGGHPAEFLAYRVLYYLYTCNRTDMNNVLAELTSTDKEQPAIKHALAVRSALALGNYHKFFRLYEDTPNMGTYLVDHFIGRERLAALANFCKA